MIELAGWIRKGSPQYLEYHFKLGCGVLSLAGYLSVSVDIKLNGDDYETLPGSFLDRSLGTVYLTRYVFTVSGLWNVQFIAVDANGDPVYGEPIQIRVVKNVNDLALSELMRY